MTDKSTSFATAKELVALYGEEAEEMAWNQVCESLAAEDLGTAMTWLTLAQAICDVLNLNRHGHLH
jgi:hypothetical protein